MKTKLLSIKARTKAKAICSLVAILVTMALPIPTHAQFDPGLHEIFQTDGFGDPVKVGEMYVPERDRGAINYVEHWVLSDKYVYPSAEARVLTFFRPARNRYASEEDFFARVTWRPGFRYVRVDSTDTDVLPGRR
ncbi:MAG TPA: hypothetical protein VMS31_07900 [Pyrinomonadaceae bacterium]|nr:hypothetical protein [Pyrinomonadaceae bacterium]